MDFFDIVEKDGSSPAVSWLNFEPSVSNFPNISSHLVATNVFTTIKNRFLFFRDFMGVRIRCGFFDIVVKDSSSPAVSCLNFEPSVSKFPNISSHLVATNVLATIKKSIPLFS